MSLSVKISLGFVFSLTSYKNIYPGCDFGVSCWKYHKTQPFSVVVHMSLILLLSQTPLVSKSTSENETLSKEKSFNSQVYYKSEF